MLWVLSVHLILRPPPPLPSPHRDNIAIPPFLLYLPICLKTLIYMYVAMFLYTCLSIFLSMYSSVLGLPYVLIVSLQSFIQEKFRKKTLNLLRRVHLIIHTNLITQRQENVHPDIRLYIFILTYDHAFIHA